MISRKKSKTIENFASRRDKVKQAFKWGLLGFCVVLTIVYAGQLKSHIRIPFISPSEE